MIFIYSATLFDMFGISKDKLTKKNTFNNLFNDALHSYYARYCDYFVTDDYGTRQKSKALYNLFDVQTKVLNVDEFLKILPDIGNLTEKDIIEFFEKFGNDIKTAGRKEFHKTEEATYTLLIPKEKYLNAFDEIIEIADKEKRFYWFTKKHIHYLSDFNFRETGKIINKGIALFGSDISRIGKFNFEKEVEEMRRNKWEGRYWSIGTLDIHLNTSEEPHKLALWLGPVFN